MFASALVAQSAPAKPSTSPTVVKPVKIAPVEAPKTFGPVRAAKKPEPVDEDAELEAMMMQ